MSAVGISSGLNTSETPSSDQLGFPGLLDNSDLQPKSARADSRITAPTSAERLNAVLEELSHLNVTGSIEIEKPIAIAGGGYCDVFIGYVRRLGGPNRVKVAVRQLRTFIMLERDFKKMLRKELKLWSSLRHPNILSLYGFTMTDEGCRFSFISEWMENGRADKFVQANPGHPIHPLILGIANGLAYLHSENVVHGDMKAENVLISDTFQPLICDFGISSRAIMTSNALAVSSTLSGNHLAGSLRWMACELLLTDPDQPDIVPQHTRKTDVWSFGMTVYELITGQVPFAHIPPSHNPLVLSNITKGVLPTLPENLPHVTSALRTSYWNLCRDCWKMNPEYRPNMETIIINLLQMGLQLDSQASREHDKRLIYESRLQPTDKGQLPRLHRWKTVAASEHDERLLENVLSDIQHLDMTRIVAIDQTSKNFLMTPWGKTWIYKAFTRNIASHQENVTFISVAFKTYELSYANKSRMRNRNINELRIWSRLNHKNVLGLLGYLRHRASESYDNFTLPTAEFKLGLPLVSKWMKNGTATTYIKSHPTCDVPSIILGSAEGLAYLHNEGVIHGNVTGQHILISDSGQALLFDFSCSRLSSEVDVGVPGSSQWMTAERENEFKFETTEKTDVWSFGRMICELLTGKNASTKRATGSLWSRSIDDPLRKPASFTEWSLLHRSLWDIAEDCQLIRQGLQPSMDDIVILLKKLMEPEDEQNQQMPQEPVLHSYLKSDKYGFVFLAWDVSLPPSSASHYVDRERKGKTPIPAKSLRSPFTHPASKCMKLILPLRGQGPVEVSSSKAVTVEDIMRTIYEHYQQKIKTHDISLRRRAEITSSFKMRCAASLQIGGPELENEVRERGICEVDRLDRKVEFETLTLISAEDNAWELHLVRSEE